MMGETLSRVLSVGSRMHSPYRDSRGTTRGRRRVIASSLGDVDVVSYVGVGIYV